MNILITNSKGIGYGGAEITITQFAQELKKRGHNVTIASSQNFNKIRTERFKFVEKWPYFLKYAYLESFFIRLIQKHSIQVINPQDRTTVVPAIRAAKRCGIPVVATFRDYWFACPRSSCLMPDYSECTYCIPSRLFKCVPWYRYPIDLYKMVNIKRAWKIIGTADAKVAVSSAVKNKLEYCNIKNGIKVMHVTRNLSLFKSVKGVNSFKKRIGLRKIVISFIGSFFYTKGMLNLFEFMPAILKDNSHVSLLLVGDGPLYDKIIAKIHEHNLEQQIVVTGRLPYEKMPVCYAASDMVLLPNLWQEPCSGVLFEAAASAKPIIASDKGGNMDFKGLFGYVLPADNPPLWEKKIRFLLKNKHMLRILGGKARKNVSEFSISRFTEDMESVYSNLISNKL